MCIFRLTQKHKFCTWPSMCSFNLLGFNHLCIFKKTSYMFWNNPSSLAKGYDPLLCSSLLIQMLKHIFAGRWPLVWYSLNGPLPKFCPRTLPFIQDGWHGVRLVENWKSLTIWGAIVSQKLLPRLSDRQIAPPTSVVFRLLRKDWRCQRGNQKP